MKRSSTEKNEKIPEVEYLKRQDRSTWCGGGPTWIFPQVCYLCDDETKKGERRDDGKAWICWDCLNEQRVAQRAIKKAESEE